MSKGQNVRHIKNQESDKINVFYPSKTHVKEDENGVPVCKVDFTETHVSHDMILDISYSHSGKRKKLPQKLSMKTSFEIIPDDIRNSVSGNIERKRLVTKKRFP